MHPTILLIHDEPFHVHTVREAIARSSDGPFRLEWLRSCAEGVSRLADQTPGTDGGIVAVVIDLFLSDSRGVETLDRLLAAAPHVPILVLSADEDEALAKEAVTRGAQDYLLTSRLDDYALPKMLGSMLARAATADRLAVEAGGAQVTLNAIGDAIVCVDVAHKVTFLNAAAERVIGCTREDAENQPLEDIFSLVDANSDQAVENPMTRAMEEGRTVGLAANCVLIRRDRGQIAIEDSTAPIRDGHGHVTGAVMVFRDVTAARALALKTAYQSSHDALTDLPNRWVLEDRLTQAIAVAQRNRKKLAVFFLDLDRFKATNDSLGHAVGDRLLQSVAQRLVASMRHSDTVSRQGGDEFVVLLTEVAHAQAAAVSADKILAALRVPHRIEGHEVVAEASIGIAIYPDDGLTVEALMKNADAAMYRGKHLGRGSRHFFRCDVAEYTTEQPTEAGAQGALGRGRGIRRARAQRA